jgi:hypothetical protein
MCFCVENIKVIPGYSKYKITTKGNIYSNYRNRYLSIKATDKDGYLKVSMFRSKKISTCLSSITKSI